MPLDEALARSVVDLSGRPYIVFESPVDKELLLVTKEFPFALVEEFWKSAAFRGKLNLHVDVIRAETGTTRPRPSSSRRRGRSGTPRL